MSTFPVLQLLSDVHLERYYGDITAVPWDASDFIGDVLLLTGDITSSPAELRKWLCLVNPQGKPVVMVAGNHEMYGMNIQTVYAEIRRAVALPWFHLLEQETVELGGVRIAGATLWSNYAEGRHLKTCKDLNDFRSIQNGPQSFTVQEAWRRHEETLVWLRSLKNAQDTGQPLVVLTHFAPSFRSQEPAYAGSPTAGHFCSNLDDFIEWLDADVWAHGHLHCSANYRIGRTLTVANPCGRPEQGRYGLVLENPRWQPHFLIDLNQASGAELTLRAESYTG